MEREQQQVRLQQEREREKDAVAAAYTSIALLEDRFIYTANHFCCIFSCDFYRLTFSGCGCTCACACACLLLQAQEPRETVAPRPGGLPATEAGLQQRVLGLGGGGAGEGCRAGKR